MDYFIIYKTTNLINGMIYIGAHKTKDIDDGYIGSGMYLQSAIKKYDASNFKREILFLCKDREEMYQKEAELVTEEFIKRDDTYNLHIGGVGGFDHVGLVGSVTVKDKDGNTSRIKCDDPRYLSGELVGINKGMTPVKDREGNIYWISISDPRYLNGELVGCSKDTTTVKDKDGNTLKVLITDIRLKTKEVVGCSKGTTTVKDKDGNTFKVRCNDPRILSGELVGINKNIKVHTDEFKKMIGELNSKRQKGEGNSQYGTIWIHNPTTKENKKIKKIDIIPEGWIKGHKFNKNK